jgi:small conductance mechanosensitive channel
MSVPIVLAADPTVVVSPPLQDACGAQPGVLCRTVFNTTHSKYLASGAEVLFAKPLRILLILLVAVIVRALINRAIKRIVNNAAEGHTALLNSLRNRGPTRLWDAVEPSPLLRERRWQRAQTVGSLLRSITTVVVFGIALVTILGELGINLAPIVASAGIVGLAVGFGAQNLVRDFLTGIFMILEDQYGVGDVIDVGPPNASVPVSGTVEAVSLRITRLRDVNGVVWHVRNGEIVRVGNMSLNWARAVVDVPVLPGTPIERARELLQEAAHEVYTDEAYARLILEEPEVWGVETFTKDALTVRVAAKTAPLKQWEVARALRERIRDIFDRGELEDPGQQVAVAATPALDSGTGESAQTSSPTSAAGGGAAPVSG